MDFESDSELVELGECDSEQELLVVRALLESQGIECFCPIISSRYYGISNTGGISLKVRRENLEAARVILDAPIENPPDASDDDDS
jgi:hypothetical protein